MWADPVTFSLGGSILYLEDGVGGGQDKPGSVCSGSESCLLRVTSDSFTFHWSPRLTGLSHLSLEWEEVTVSFLQREVNIRECLNNPKAEKQEWKDFKTAMKTTLTYKKKKSRTI